MKDYLENQILRYDKGLIKLVSTEQEVKGLQKNLEELKPVLEEKNK